MILANLNLLFWLSLVPFATGWMGENHFETNTLMLYGLVLLLCGFSYFILQKLVEKNSHELEDLELAFKMLNKKGMVSTISYIVAIPLSLVNPFIAFAIYIITAIMWLIPDKNIEKALNSNNFDHK